MTPPNEPRDLLAERLRRLEARIADLGAELGATRSQLERAGGQLDTLVDLVGRLSRVVDVQGSSLHGEESALERKVGSLDERLGALASGLSGLASELDAIRSQLGRSRGREPDGGRGSGA